MPHDKNGARLQVGDVVTIEATVTQIFEGDEFCNVQMDTVEPMYPGTDLSGITLNAKQVAKREPAAE